MRYVVFLVLIGFAVILSANVYAMPPFHSQQIYDLSNVIVVGKVVSVNSTFSPTHNLYEIKVEKFLKNQQDSDVLFAAGQKTTNIRLGNQVFDVNDRGLFYLTNNTMGYDPYSGIFLVYPTSQLIEPKWDKCNIFDKEIPKEHWVFGGTGQMPAIRQGNNTDIENFVIGKQVLVSYDIFNHLPDAKNVTFGIMIKKSGKSDYLYTETNSYLLEPCVPYKTLIWTFTPTESGQYAVELDLAGSQMAIGFTAKSLPLCTSDRSACSQDYTCDPAGWKCADTGNIFNIDSPLKQFKSGIPSQQVSCKEGLDLVIKKNNGHPICVKPHTKSKLLQNGVAEQPQITEEGFAIPKNYNALRSILTVEGSSDTYSVGQKIEFTVKFNGIGYGCGYPQLRIEDSNHEIVWESGRVVSLCDPDMKKIPIEREWVINDSTHFGIPVIDKGGYYTLFVTYDDAIIQKDFVVRW